LKIQKNLNFQDLTPLLALACRRRWRFRPDIRERDNHLRGRESGLKRRDDDFNRREHDFGP
jgi:hypothetical protein